MAKKYDFAGWATKNDVRCADGRIIRRNAFKDQNGQTVPLFWNHQHNDPEMVLGHAVLLNMDDGVYAEGYFNNSAKARHVKDAIAHGDLLALSIYANQLKQDGSNVLHGVIRELSVVPGGANPEALIETAMLAHGDLWEQDVVVFNSEDEEILSHSAVEDEEVDETEEEEDMGNNELDVEAVLNTLTDEQMEAVAALINDDELSHSDEDQIAEVLDTLDDEQKEAVAELLESIAEDEEEEDEDEDEDEELDVEAVLDTLTDEQAEAVASIINDDELSHSDEDQIAEVLDTLTDEQKEAVAELLDSIAEDEEDDEDEEDEEEENEDNEDDEDLSHSADDDTEYAADVLKTLNEEQKRAVAILLDAVIDGDEEDDEDYEDEEEESVKHNVFENETYGGPVLSHSDMQVIFEDWKRCGSLKEAFKHQLEDGVLAHTVYNHNDAGEETTAQTYGIADINYLFPDARTLQPEPDFISRQMDWVKKIMNGTRHTPFSRVKSIFADITMEEARAKGYTKGGLKADEVFSLLKRVTTPQTIYKKQKLDRDDIIDITDFNVVAWIKAEMRMMLEEEAARAMLVGDGRSNVSADKISEEHIRPIYKDASLYTIRTTVTAGTPAETAAAIVKASVKARKDYRGSGNTVMFTTPAWHTEMILLEDKMGRPLYDTDEKLRNKMRVNDIIDVEPMENQIYNGKELAAIIVDLRDYNVGADKGGEVNFFDDFDLDYNRERYLIESRFSGALVKPYSAIVVEIAGGSSDTDTDSDTN